METYHITVMDYFLEQCSLLSLFSHMFNQVCSKFDIVSLALNIPVAYVTVNCKLHAKAFPNFTMQYIIACLFDERAWLPTYK